MYGRNGTRWGCIYLPIGALIFCLVLLLPQLSGRASGPGDALLSKVNHLISSSSCQAPTTKLPTLESVKDQYAYLTYLSSDNDGAKDEDFDNDKYFVAVRTLIYQMLHAPSTRSPNGYPFIVIVTQSVSEAKRDRLRRDGAIVWEPALVDPGWVHTAVTEWQSILAKLRAWELTQFERVCFLDGDTILTRPMDDVFSDPAVDVQHTTTNEEEIKADEEELPREYVFAGTVQLEEGHQWPPDRREDVLDWDYLNGGFFVLRPDLAVLKYYLSLLHTPDRFEAGFMEQGLLNYAHRMSGNMPWAKLHQSWNAQYGSKEDLAGGVAALHDKWWKPWNSDMKPYMESWRWRMDGFFQARDAYVKLESS